MLKSWRCLPGSCGQISTYVLRDMTSPESGFFSAEDADSEGIEGKFYLWTPQQIQKLLGEKEAAFFNRIFNVKEGGNFQDAGPGHHVDQNILHLQKPLPELTTELGIPEEQLQRRLEANRKILFAARKKRIHPLKDDKILTDWNGLMISAFCKGYQVLGDQKYLTAAQKAVDFLLEKLYIGERILKTYRNGKSHLNGFLSDYAFLVAALIDVYESNFEWKYLRQAIEINDLMLQKFWDESSGGFYFTPIDHERLIVRTRNPYDNAIPAGNSVEVHNLLKLSQFTGDFKLKEQAALKLLWNG